MTKHMTDAVSTATVMARYISRGGIRHLFGYPGDPNIEFMEQARREGIEFVLGRREGTAAFMAEAYGQLTGRPGVCLSTLGPGCTNLVNGVATAFLDRTPHDRDYRPAAVAARADVHASERRSAPHVRAGEQMGGTRRSGRGGCDPPKGVSHRDSGTSGPVVLDGARRRRAHASQRLAEVRCRRWNPLRWATQVVRHRFPRAPSATPSGVAPAGDPRRASVRSARRPARPYGRWRNALAVRSWSRRRRKVS